MTELVVEDRGAVRILALNRPEKHNALNEALIAALMAGLDEAELSASVNAVVLTGNGKSFCAGADTKELASSAAADPRTVLRRADLTVSLHLAFSRMSKPVISAVRGNALGAGAGLALACDMMVMADNARFGYPELKHGIVAALVLANLVRQLGQKNAFELVAMGDAIDGHRALALGITNRVTAESQVLDTALEIATRLAGWEPAAMATTKRAFYRATELSLESALGAGRDANLIMRGFRNPAKPDAAK
ncbi:MAG: enoyl-CoA hydratase/isomerase family protein [Tardiphaga sp.]